MIAIADDNAPAADRNNLRRSGGLRYRRVELNRGTTNAANLSRDQCRRRAMKWRMIVCSAVASLLTATFPILAQVPQAKSPIASNPVVEVQGKILTVNLMAGAGMPSLEMDRGGKPVTVWLGSMRYLARQNFSPKAGEMAEVRGYTVKNENQQDEIVAISVKLPATNQVLRLRDESGYPLWAPGCRYCGYPTAAGAGWGSGGHHHCGHW
jgi:hypothetical protein